ncbi:MAG: 50S ribosomal protein L20 [Acidobacteriota bacterium]
MPRVKRGTVRRAKRKRLLDRAKGFFLNKSKLYRAAKEAVDKALNYGFVGRRNKKRDYRRLWIVRINAAAREHSWTYRELIHGLALAGITIDRKHLADLAVNDKPAFKTVLDQARRAFDAAPKKPAAPVEPKAPATSAAKA